MLTKDAMYALAVEIARTSEYTVCQCCTRVATTEGLGIISFLFERSLCGLFVGITLENDKVDTAMLMNLRNFASKLIVGARHDGAPCATTQIVFLIEQFELDQEGIDRLRKIGHVETPEQLHFQRLLRKLRETEQIDLEIVYHYHVFSGMLSFSS